MKVGAKTSLSKKKKKKKKMPFVLQKRDLKKKARLEPVIILLKNPVEWDEY